MVTMHYPPTSVALTGRYSVRYERVRFRANILLWNRSERVDDLRRARNYWARIQHAYEALLARQKYEATLGRKRSLRSFRKRLFETQDELLAGLRGPVAARYVAYYNRRIQRAEVAVASARGFIMYLDDKQREHHLL